MERALPVLRKHYLLYADYAGLEMKDAFYGFAEQVMPLEADRLSSAVCYGNGKGGFALTDLPAPLQLSPIFAFQKILSATGENQYISGGNFFNVIPYEGRYDAQAAALFSIAKNKVVTCRPQQGLAALQGEVRDLKWVKRASDSVLVAARNNEALLFLKR
ncbi:MAG TPA: hypothetical protein VM010_08485, partial [Chitinophagaceae bacterium]|nr:hypothetical protein [Chitinophagaceae bacterium]